MPENRPISGTGKNRTLSTVQSKIKAAMKYLESAGIEQPELAALASLVKEKG